MAERVRMALVGATATGKTALATGLARRRGDLELVSVDAMAVYRGLDIGTAKPTSGEREGLRWHLLDLVDPAEEFSLARFQRAATDAVAQANGRGHGVVLVGGTGLYHRAVIDGLDIPARYGTVRRALEAEAEEPGGLEALYRRLSELDPVAAGRIEPANARRIVRALEVTLGAGRPFSSFGSGLTSYAASPYRQVGISLPRPVLDARIEQRLDAQFAAGFVTEAERLWRRAEGLSRTARQALGYRELFAHFAGECSLDEARAEILRRTRSFARRQESWFRRDPRIVWLDGERVDLIDVVGGLIQTEGD